MTTISKAEIDEVVKKALTATSPLNHSAEYPVLSGSLGADPEFLYEDKDGNILPSFAYLEDKKPGEYSEPYVDGWQGEFGVSPNTCISYLVDDIHVKLAKACTAIPRAEGRVSIRSVLDISQEQLFSDPERAQFGCTPSLNAYDDFGFALDGLATPFRMAGGHIHLGVTERGKAFLATHQATIVKYIDSVAGVIGAALFNGLEDVRRRLLYGRAGEYRLPPHGLEYRVPSNAWLLHPAVAHFYLHVVRFAARTACNEILCHGLLPFSFNVKQEEVVRAINNTDAELARSIIAKNKEFFIYVVFNAARGHEQGMCIWKAMHEGGILSLLPDNYSLEKAWKIGTRSEWARHSNGLNQRMGELDKEELSIGKLGVCE